MLFLPLTAAQVASRRPRPDTVADLPAMAGIDETPTPTRQRCLRNIQCSAFAQASQKIKFVMGEAHNLPGVPAIAVRDNVGTANQPPLTALATMQNTDRQGANAVGRRPQEGGSGMETDSHEG